MSASRSSPLSASRSAFAVRARSLARSVVGRSLLSFRNIWIWPIVALVMLATIGWFLRGAIEDVIRGELASELETILDTDVTALRIWMKTQEANALSAAGDLQVVELVGRLVRAADEPGVGQLELLGRPELQALREELRPTLAAGGYNGFIVVNRAGVVVASQRNDAVGLTGALDDSRGPLDRVMAGEPTVLPPTKSRVVLPDRSGELRAGVPTMFALAPVRGGDGSVVAALGLRINPEREFTQILRVASLGASGETYAFNRSGLLLSSSRFDADLRRMGLLTEDADSILNLTIRDPGVDLSRGQRTALPRSEQPLTRMAQAATQGESGVDVVGYRDYRGVPVVGAWTWLDDHEFGIATEIDVTEAYQPLYILRRVFFGMFALLALAALAIFVFTLIVAKLNRDAQLAALEARQLGQYKLDQKLGEGGMGVVYRAHHALLNRPTAVKFLDVDKTSEQTIARFEREVQLTSQLNHPNTIAIYDYGRTDEGIFYYAMEYLDGVNLDDFVRRYGPQPDGRIVSILRQVCGSLNEAHGLGLIHRDIKPANIVLNHRGGVGDVVKLLDFGLVKVVDSRKQASLTSAGGLTGTPLYLSPEAIHSPASVDARSDLYAVGAVGYFLLTGTPVFDLDSVLEIIQHHAHMPPEPPSARLGRPVSIDLEQVLLRCLAKNPAERPQTARELSDLLAACVVTTPWTETDAERWWRTYRPQSSSAGPAGTDDGRYAATLLGAAAEDA